MREFAVMSADSINKDILVKEEEFNLLRQIAELPDEIKASAETLEPSKLTRYSVELANAFHSFYNECHVNIEDEELSLARLKLIDCARITLANVLELLKVEAPEKM